MPMFFEHCNQCDILGNNNTCLSFSDENFMQVCLMSCTDENQLIVLVWALVILITALIIVPSGLRSLIMNKEPAILSLS